MHEVVLHLNSTKTIYFTISNLANFNSIMNAIRKVFKITLLLDKKRVLVTAGPTRESIDPVRFLSNRSSGKMGFAIAESAKNRHFPG